MKTNMAYGAITLLMISCKTATVPERRGTETGVSVLGSGSYYIIHANSGRALTPNSPSEGQNVFLRPFSHSGTQKWVLEVKGKNTSIHLCGYDALIFQPHPSVSDRPPVVSPDFMGGGSAQFHIEPAGRPGLWRIRSAKLNNDALQGTQTSEEPGFGSITANSSQQLWKLIPADCR
ncbi:hypothetical protein PV783_13170 [Chitinophaga sp. CC14]|uniref:RICIN domain-containing protein n=1 Tax=Chitinophaga sp. CC14 TaxID=3029199 RepID=UPI003B81E3EE